MTMAVDFVGPRRPVSDAPAADALNDVNGIAAFDAGQWLARQDRSIVFVDLETTGSDPLKDRITEIGVVEAGPEGIKEWTIMLDPEQPIPPFIQQLTGIDNDMVRGQPHFAAIAPALLARLEGKLFIAHNARFDYGFLKSEFRRVGLRFRADVLCTVKLSRSLFPSMRKHGLDALIERFQLVPRARHRALADADLLWQFWQKIHARLAPAVIETAIDSLVRKTSLPTGLDEDVLDTLPAMPGVYIFYGERDVPIYVGKATDLKLQVSTHFASDQRAAKDLRLARDVRRIECRQTAGDIGALLLEAQLIKTLAPLHNRMLRKRGAACSWLFPEDASAPRLTSPRERDFGRADYLYGVFDSKAKAESRLRKLADEHDLCLVGLGLEKTKPGGPCLNAQRQRCRGACTGAESATHHARRVRQALEPLRIAPWPHAGAIAFAERHLNGSMQWHVVDNWSYLGSSEDDRALRKIATSAAVPLFDRDIYTILRRVFNNPKLAVLPLNVEHALQLDAPKAEPVAATASSAAAEPANSADSSGSADPADSAAAASATARATASTAEPLRRPLTHKAAPVGQLTLDFARAV